MLMSRYRVDRCYGGPEEGGWWYDFWTFECVVGRGSPKAQTLPKPVLDPDGGTYGRFSCLSYEGDTVYVWERRKAERETRKTPRFE